jgi:ribosomal protein L11 methylase PrmA
MKEWAEISIQTAQEAVEAVANVLHEAGAGGVVIEDPTYLPVHAEEFGVGELPEFPPSNGQVTAKAYLPVNDQLPLRLQVVQDEINRVLKIIVGGRGYIAAKSSRRRMGHGMENVLQAVSSRRQDRS